MFSILTCKEALARLDDYVDRELSPRETQLVERHLKICRHCTEIFAFETDFIDEVKQKVQHIETDDAGVNALLKRIKAALPGEVPSEAAE